LDFRDAAVQIDLEDVLVLADFVDKVPANYLARVASLHALKEPGGLLGET